LSKSANPFRNPEVGSVSKSRGLYRPCGFDSYVRHHIFKKSDERVPLKKFRLGQRDRSGNELLGHFSAFNLGAIPALGQVTVNKVHV
jgi:hypothetical protein